MLVCVFLDFLLYLSWCLCYVETALYLILTEPFLGTKLYFFFTDATFINALKITLCLMFLIVIRGCIPRYRYDFLTKIGWVKFLGFVLAFFLLTLVLFLF